MMMTALVVLMLITAAHFIASRSGSAHPPVPGGLRPVSPLRPPLEVPVLRVVLLVRALPLGLTVLIVPSHATALVLLLLLLLLLLVVMMMAAFIV